MANNALTERASDLKARAAHHLNNPMLKAMGIAALIAELLQLVRDIAARIEGGEA